jgi:cytochrome P450
MVADLDLPALDLAEPDFTADRYHARLAELRELGWLARTPIAYLVLDHDAGEFFLRSRATAFPGRQLAELFGITDGPLAAPIDANILNLTGPRHRRLRALVGPAFTPRKAERWRPAMRATMAGLWAELAAGGECEFVHAMARPYPAMIIAQVLGAPAKDAIMLHEWADLVQRQFDIRALETQRSEIEQAVLEIEQYVTALLDGKHGDDDLIAELLSARDGGDRLSAAECINLVANLIAGGIDTTAGQLGHAIRLFAAHPEQWTLLAADPALAPRAVEEVLRFEPVTPFTARICTDEVIYRDVLFPAGSIVAICAEQANREEPGSDRFDITAERSGRLLTFGAGAHYCLGVNLAHAELEEALAFLAPRMPGLAIAAPPVLGGVEGVYGPDELIISWNPAEIP